MTDQIAPGTAQAPAAQETADPNVSTPPAGSEQPAASPEPALQAEAPAIGETPAAPADTSDPEPPAPKRRTAEDRIKELVAERNALRDLLGNRETAAKPAEAPKPAAAEKAPVIEDFESVNEWAAAFASFQEERAAQVVERHLGKVKEREQAQSVQQQFAAREAEFVKSTPDYAVMVTDESLAEFVTPTISEAIVASDIGPQLSYHLATHREELAAIARMRPTQQGVALGKLEARLAAAPAPKPAPPKKVVQQTQAPAPPSPVGGSPSSKRLEDMPLDEYLANRPWASGNR